MKVIRFREHLSKHILDNKKNTTWRLFDDKDLSVGDDVSFVVYETGQEFARAKLTNVRETTFGQLTPDDWQGHDKYSSEIEMYKIFSHYYNRPVNKNSPVKVIKFDLE
jgi:hypothetical protein